MQNVTVELAGVLAIVVGTVHGVLGETKVFSKAVIEPAWAKRMIRLVWLASAVAWVGGGLILLAVPFLQPTGARIWIIAVLVLVYGAGAIGNAWATRGRHMGWKLLTGVVVLALVGI